MEQDAKQISAFGAMILEEVFHVTAMFLATMLKKAIADQVEAIFTVQMQKTHSEAHLDGPLDGMIEALEVAMMDHCGCQSALMAGLLLVELDFINPMDMVHQEVVLLSSDALIRITQRR